jgi:N utilization substance protein A
MKGELLSIIEYMEKDRGLDRGTVLQAVQDAIAAASRKVEGIPPGVHVLIDPNTGAISAHSELLVVADGEPGPAHAEGEEPPPWLHQSEVLKYLPKAEPGTMVHIDLDMELFGRISAQTAKQVIIQRVREAERENILAEYSQRIGDLVHGTVSRVDRGTLLVDLGRTEAHLPKAEQSPNERYRPGDRIRALVKDVKDTELGRVPRVILSRAHPGLIRRLFELEVPEIYDGIVEIKSIAREAGFRTKVAVVSHDIKIDSVGACVGIRGARVKGIVQEIGGEKIDIVRWSDNIEEFVANALAPVEIARSFADAETERILVVVPDDQLSLAIGKSGQNIRLTSKLTQWRVDVVRQSEADRVAREHGVELTPAETKPATVFVQPEGVDVPPPAPSRSAATPKEPSKPRTKRERVASIFKTLEETSAPVPDTAPAAPMTVPTLDDVRGITPDIICILKDNGITTVAELLAANPATLAALPGMDAATVDGLVDAARTLV